jgi:transcriptional regulator with XRE-family HTH domain
MSVENDTKPFEAYPGSTPRRSRRVVFPLCSSELFSNVLYEARTAAGLSCNELARVVEVDPSYISRIERVEREAPPRQTIKTWLLRWNNLPADTRVDLMLSAGYLPELSVPPTPQELAELNNGIVRLSQRAQTMVPRQKIPPRRSPLRYR